MDVEVNLVGVALATVAAMLVGAIWYSKGVFGAEWMKLVKLNEKKAQKEAPKAMSVMFVLAAITAYAIAWLSFVVSAWLEIDSYLAASLQTALMVWVAFAFATHVSNGMFEQRSSRLMAINVGNSLVTYLAMGLAIGLVGV